MKHTNKNLVLVVHLAVLMLSPAKALDFEVLQSSAEVVTVDSSVDDNSENGNGNVGGDKCLVQVNMSGSDTASVDGPGTDVDAGSYSVNWKLKWKLKWLLSTRPSGTYNFVAESREKAIAVADGIWDPSGRPMLLAFLEETGAIGSKTGFDGRRSLPAGGFLRRECSLSTFIIAADSQVNSGSLSRHASIDYDSDPHIVGFVDGQLSTWSSTTPIYGTVTFSWDVTEGAYIGYAEVTELNLNMIFDEEVVNNVTSIPVTATAVASGEIHKQYRLISVSGQTMSSW